MTTTRTTATDTTITRDALLAASARRLADAQFTPRTGPAPTNSTPTTRRRSHKHSVRHNHH
jgi:hypothetical protein